MNEPVGDDSVGAWSVSPGQPFTSEASMAHVCQTPFVELHLALCPDGARDKGRAGRPACAGVDAR